jgi:hypothetical protein
MPRKTIFLVWLVALALAPFHLAEGQKPAKVAKIGELVFRSASARAFGISPLSLAANCSFFVAPKIQVWRGHVSEKNFSRR